MTSRPKNRRSTTTFRSDLDRAAARIDARSQERRRLITEFMDQHMPEAALVRKRFNAKLVRFRSDFVNYGPGIDTVPVSPRSPKETIEAMRKARKK